VISEQSSENCANQAQNQRQYTADADWLALGPKPGLRRMRQGDVFMARSVGAVSERVHAHGLLRRLLILVNTFLASVSITAFGEHLVQG
jgi:hypothetical protein